jgi:ABC-type amino acid transport substrate-binding protein
MRFWTGLYRWRWVAALLFAGLAWQGVAEDLTAVKARGVLRVLTVRVQGTNEFFPVGGRQQGFDRELLEGFASLQGITIEPVAVEGWDDLIPALLRGRGDLIAGRFTVTEARRRQIAFTQEVFPTRAVVVTRQPNPPITTLAALRIARVGTLKGSSLADAVAQAGVPAANVDATIQPGGLPQALARGRVDAVVMGVENAITAQREDAALEMGLFIGPPGSLAWGLRVQDKALVAALDTYLENVRRSPAWSRLVVKYFGSAAPEILQRARAQ